MSGIWLLIAAFFAWAALFQLLAKPGMIVKRRPSRVWGDAESPPSDPANSRRKCEFYDLYERLRQDRVFRFRVVWAVLAILTIFVLLPINWLAACLAGIGIALLARGVEKSYRMGLRYRRKGKDETLWSLKRK